MKDLTDDMQALRQAFIHYLRIHEQYARPDIMASNVLYSCRHDIGMPFAAIFVSNASMQRARELLTAHFETIGRKDPKRHAGVHYGCWVKFREFLIASGRRPEPST